MREGKGREGEVVRRKGGRDNEAGGKLGKGGTEGNKEGEGKEGGEERRND